MSDRWLVSKEALEIALCTIENVPTRNGIKSSEYIKLAKDGKNNPVMYLCSDIGGKATIITGEPYPFDKDLFIDRRLFVPFVNVGKESKAKDYIFILAGDTLSVKHGRRKAFYALSEPISGYENPKKLDIQQTIITKKWANLIDCAEFAATPDPITPSLNCIYLCQKEKQLEVLSFNGRLAFYGKTVSDRKPLKGFIAFPLGLIKSLNQEGALKLSWTDKLAIIEFPKGRVWQAVKTDARKNFPEKDIRKMVADALVNSVLVGISSSAFADVVDRLAKCVAPLMSDELGLEVYLTKGTNKVKIVAGSKDSNFTEILYSLTKAKEDLVIDWPLQQVTPIILFAKDEGVIKVHKAKNDGTCISTKSLALIVAGREK